MAVKGTWEYWYRYIIISIIFLYLYTATMHRLLSYVSLRCNHNTFNDYSRNPSVIEMRLVWVYWGYLKIECKYCVWSIKEMWNEASSLYDKVFVILQKYPFWQIFINVIRVFMGVDTDYVYYSYFWVIWIFKSIWFTYKE